MRTKNRSWCILLFILILTNFNGNAYDFEVNGIYYNIISQSNLEVEVTHKYDRVNSSNETYIGAIIIPENVYYNNRTYTVTKIGQHAFGTGGLYWDEYKGCKITSVFLPTTIKGIDKEAFCRCVLLENINLSDQLQSIGYGAFYQSGLTSVVIPDEIETIGNRAFGYCEKLRSCILGKEISVLEDSAFVGCTSLLEVFFTSIEVPKGYADAFLNCNRNMESYVPSTKIYKFGKDYVSFDSDSFEYSGGIHNINWTNNIKDLNCNIAHIQTEVNAGNYTKYVTANYSGDMNFTVEIPYQYTITPVPLTLTVANVEREYGEPNPTFTCTATGFVPGENLSNIGVTPIFKCDASQTSNAGIYRISADLNTKNYNIICNPGTLTVTKAPITVSVKSSSRIYGDGNPSFELLYTGLKNNEISPTWSLKPTFSTKADTKSSVGDYEVTVQGGDALNYIVTKYYPGVLSILKRDLKVRANNAERLYGEDNPIFQISYSGFVNSESQNVLLTQPEAYCNATTKSNVGEYPIIVKGGSAENYNLVYEYGTLFINPLTIGFKKVYNTVKFDDMSFSTTDKYFNYLPEIEGPFNEEDFYIDLWFMDGDNKYSNHVYTESSGSYKGNYVNTNYDRPMQAGKYIFNLTSKGTNKNLVANPSRCYLTVETNSTNLTWNDSSPIIIQEGKTVELDISYLAYIYCQFNVNYDKDVITLSVNDQASNYSQWFATGLKEGETTVSIGISCLKNDMGFYDFYDSKIISKKIKVIPANANAVENIDNEAIIIMVENKTINISNKPENVYAYIYDTSGNLILRTADNIIEGISKGLYIVKIGNKSKKVII